MTKEESTKAKRDDILDTLAVVVFMGTVVGGVVYLYTLYRPVFEAGFRCMSGFC